MKNHKNNKDKLKMIKAHDKNKTIRIKMKIYSRILIKSKKIHKKITKVNHFLVRKAN
jgi:hypothetical protein